MIDLSQWRASIGSWNFCQRPTRSNHSCSIRSANGCRYHLFSTTAEKKEIKLLKIVAFLVVFELVFLALFLSIHILLHYSPVRLTGIVGGYSSFQYTVISAENWLQSEPICFHDNLLLLLLSGDVELNPGPRGALDVLNEDDLIDIIDALNEGEFTTPKWYSLGLQLRISHDDLRTIEADFRNVDRCLTKCIVKWLKTGKATYTELAEALGKMGEDAAAYHIRHTLQPGTKQDTQYQVHVSPGSSRDDPKVAYEVFKSNISDIKRRAKVDLHNLADKLREEMIISEKDKEEAIDDYTTKSKADRRGKLIDKVQETLKAGVGGAFGIFLGILRAEKVLQFNKLAEELEEKYDKVAGVPGATSSQPLSSASSSTLDGLLGIDDKDHVLDALEKHNFTTTGWRTLCGRLGLSHNSMSTIENNHVKNVERQLDEGISCWLRGKGYKKPSWSMLVKALKGMGERAVADGIEKTALKQTLQPGTKQGTQDQVHVSPDAMLSITHLSEVWSALREGKFKNSSWIDLGVELGLHPNTLSTIEANYPRDSKRCARECLVKWLEGADGVDEKGGANWKTLSNALEAVGQKNAADHIKHHNTEQDTQDQVHVSPDCVQSGTLDTEEAASQQCTDGPDLPNEVAQDNEEATAITNSATLDRNTKHQRSWCSYGMILICFGAIIFALLAFITAIMMSTTSLQCLLNRNSFMCTLEKMLSDGAGITLNNDGEKAPHVSLTSPSFSEESLDTTQLADIIQALKNSNYDISTWHDLCLNLGLNQGTLNTIERDKSDSNERLKTCLHKWLNRVDQVDSKGGATKSSLVRALENIGQKPVAEKMRN